MGLGLTRRTTRTAALPEGAPTALETGRARNMRDWCSVAGTDVVSGMCGTVSRRGCSTRTARSAAVGRNRGLHAERTGCQLDALCVSRSLVQSTLSPPLASHASRCCSTLHVCRPCSPTARPACAHGASCDARRPCWVDSARQPPARLRRRWTRAHVPAKSTSMRLASRPPALHDIPPSPPSAPLRDLCRNQPALRLDRYAACLYNVNYSPRLTRLHLSSSLRGSALRHQWPPVPRGRHRFPCSSPIPPSIHTTTGPFAAHNTHEPGYMRAGAARYDLAPLASGLSPASAKHVPRAFGRYGWRECVPHHASTPRRQLPPFCGHPSTSRTDSRSSISLAAGPRSAIPPTPPRVFRARLSRRLPHVAHTRPGTRAVSRTCAGRQKTPHISTHIARAAVKRTQRGPCTMHARTHPTRSPFAEVA